MAFKIYLAAAVGTLIFACSPRAPAQDSLLDDGIHICSKLGFNGAQWPAAVSDRDKNAIALALNISSSFEGETEWVNLTNDFDGQGVSIGLLNQCLGQGSLQPLLIEMENTNPANMKAYFPPSDLESMTAMLQNWQSASFVDERLALRHFGFSALDDESLIEPLVGDQVIESEKQAELRNARSVKWAVENLYIDRKFVFKPVWFSAFTAMANSAPYRSIQLEQAVAVHQSALTLYGHFGMHELRSYLFFFDLIVQNGGINDAILARMDRFLARHRRYNEVQKLYYILNERLRFVNRRYVNDVRRRKLAIIRGKGWVHGWYRNFDREYCTHLDATF